MNREIFRTSIVCMVLLSSLALATEEELVDTRIWGLPAGQMDVQFRPDNLETFGVEVFHRGEPVTTRGRLPVEVLPGGNLTFEAPHGNFEDFNVGQLPIVTDLEFRYEGRSLRVGEAALVPARFYGQPGLALIDAQGRELFNLTHFHVLSRPADGLLEIQNADIYPTEVFAEALGFPDHRALHIGIAAFELDMAIPEGADVSQVAPQCSSPTWPQEGLPADVELIAMSQILQMGTPDSDGSIKVTPSATLKNVGEADIPWVPKFGQIADYEYEPRDQHPYLLWAMYRIHDGRIEMLANSGAKHAWLTVNTACPCSGGNILWPDCEDVYGTGINDAGSDLGPRGDIEASLGLFDTCGSFFDPDCVGSQTQGSGTGFQNRLVVHPDEFEWDGAEYFFDSWYVVQYDVDIWNTMGYRPINPTPGSGEGWTFNPGPFEQGPAISEWVGEDREPMADHQRVVVPSAKPDEPYPDNMPQGHLRLLVRVHDQEDGTYRYNYALQNYDFERGITEFHIPLDAGMTVSDTYFGGVGEIDDWDVEIGADGVTFTAPEGQFQPWFTLYNFEVEVDSAPVTGELLLGLGNDAVMDEMPVTIMAPATGGEVVPEIFDDRFEELGLFILPQDRFTSMAGE